MACIGNRICERVPLRVSKLERVCEIREGQLGGDVHCISVLSTLRSEMSTQARPDRISWPQIRLESHVS